MYTRPKNKIVQRNMDQRVVIKECYDYLLKLSMEPIHDQFDTDLITKCMAKGRLLRKQYLDYLIKNNI